MACSNISPLSSPNWPSCKSAVVVGLYFTELREGELVLSDRSFYGPDERIPLVLRDDGTLALNDTAPLGSGVRLQRTSSDITATDE
jgi:hypothetical protein